MGVCGDGIAEDRKPPGGEVDEEVMIKRKPSTRAAAVVVKAGRAEEPKPIAVKLGEGGPQTI